MYYITPPPFQKKPHIVPCIQLCGMWYLFPSCLTMTTVKICGAHTTCHTLRTSQSSLPTAVPQKQVQLYLYRPGSQAAQKIVALASNSVEESGFKMMQFNLKLLPSSSSLNPLFLSSGRDLERSKEKRQWAGVMAQSVKCLSQA